MISGNNNLFVFLANSIGEIESASKSTIVNAWNNVRIKLIPDTINPRIKNNNVLTIESPIYLINFDYLILFNITILCIQEVFIEFLM